MVTIGKIISGCRTYCYLVEVILNGLGTKYVVSAPVTLLLLVIGMTGRKWICNFTGVSSNKITGILSFIL